MNDDYDDGGGGGGGGGDDDNYLYSIHLLIKSDKFRVRWHNVIVTVYWESNLTEWQPGMHPSVLLLISQSPHREWKTESVISIHAIRGSMFKLMWTGGGKKS